MPYREFRNVDEDGCIKIDERIELREVNLGSPMDRVLVPGRIQIEENLHALPSTAPGGFLPNIT